MKNIIKIISLLLIISSIFMVSSCNKSDVPDGMIEIGTEFTSYHLYVPESWTDDSKGGFSSAKTEDGSNISLQTMSLSGVFENNGGYIFYVGNETFSSIDEYFKNVYSKSLSSTFTNYNLKEEYTQNQTFGKSDKCSKYVYEISVDEKTYVFQQIFTINGSNLYIFTYTAEESKYETHLDDVVSITKNFLFN